MSTADSDNNAPIAFVLVTCAGMSTTIGAAFVFNKHLVKLASKRVLAGALAASAGVMLYVSFVEILVKSQTAFEDAGYNPSDAYLYATLCFFGGIIVYKLIHLLVHLLDGSAADHNVDVQLYDLDHHSSGEVSPRSPSALGAVAGAKAAVAKAGGHGHDHEQQHLHAIHGAGGPVHPHSHNVVVELDQGSSVVQPSPNLHTLHLRMAGKVCSRCNAPTAAPQGPATPAGSRSGSESEEGGEAKEPVPADAAEAGVLGELAPRKASAKGAAAAAAAAAAEQGPAAAFEEAMAVGAAAGQAEDKKLVRMGLMTALAIGIHNFPEGLATFVGALADPSVGFALAVAIAIHNIPEGVCVAMPVYYATGSRCKAFGWALLSGVSEPLAAGLGWLVLKDVMSDTIYGVLFGLVAGMMVHICIHELIPTANRYDPADKVTTNSLIVGMAVMAVSLTLFLY